MPVNFRAIKRRRILLGLTQQDLAITAGVSHSTICKMENETIPNEGGGTGVDLIQRLAQALRMDVKELLIMPEGNRYQRAVQFAAYQQDAAANPKLHDRGRTIRAENYRRLTRGQATPDTQAIIDRDEGDPIRELPAEPDYSFERDPSTE